MDSVKKKRLEAKGWRVGSVREFLQMSEAETELVEMRLRLAHAFATARGLMEITQAAAAKLIGSSQSRVAKLESGDSSVSIELAIRALLSLGENRREIGAVIAGRRVNVRTPRTRAVKTLAASRRASRQ